MATDSYLVITDGTTTVTIADGSGGSTNYQLARGTWAPRVAGQRRSELGGRGPYEDVVEEMQLNITGSSIDAALANLSVLTNLIDQADRWSDNENTCAVLLKYSPKGATVSSMASPLQAAILGRPGDQDAIFLPGNFEQVGINRFILGAMLRFERRGLWLHTTQSVISSAASNAYTITTSGLSALNILSPTKIALTNIAIAASSGNTFEGGYIAIASNTLDLTNIWTSWQYAGSSYTSITTDASSLSRSASILRYTPTVTTEEKTTNLGISYYASVTRRLAIFANVKNNSSSTTFKIRVSLWGAGAPIYTSYVTIPVSFGPEWILLGLVSFEFDIKEHRIHCVASQVSGTLDIEGLLFMDMTPRENKIIAIKQSNDNFDTSGLYTATIDHRSLSNPIPIVSAVMDTYDNPVQYAGDAYLSTQASATAIVIMQTGRLQSSGKTWRVGDSSGCPVMNTVTKTRIRGYLSPV